MKKALCALLWLFAVTGAMAQIGVDGTILGVVTDANGGVIAGATVTVTQSRYRHQEVRNQPLGRKLRNHSTSCRPLFDFRNVHRIQDLDR